MTFYQIIRKTGELATQQFPHMDLDVRDSVIQAIHDVQRANPQWSFLRTTTTATIAAGSSSAVFANTNEFRSLQNAGGTPVTVSDGSVSPPAQLWVEVLSRGEIERLNQRGGLGSNAYNAFTSLQEPVWIERNSSLSGVLHVQNNVDSERVYTIKAYLLLTDPTSVTDSNLATDLYGDLIVHRARANLYASIAQYELAKAERDLYNEMLVQAIREDAYADLGGKPVRM